MANQLTLPPPPEGVPISTDGVTSNEWQTWFSLLQNILDSQGLTHYPPVTPGGGEQPYYWHKLYDPAWMHMYFDDLGSGKVVPIGSPITGYDVNAVDPFQISTDLAAGTVTVDSTNYVDEGMYHMSISIFGDIGQNDDCTIGLYRDGVVTNLGLTIVTKSVPTSTAVFSGLVPVTNGVYDLRVLAGSTITIYTIGWSMHRVSPLPEWEG